MIISADRIAYSVITVAALSVWGSTGAQEPFAIVIERKHRGPDCTSGYLAINGQVKMHALELPWQNNATNLSSIPAGKYKGILRYDKNDRWRIQLEDVPKRPGIQLHMGNTVNDSSGCVLVGMKLKQGTMCVIEQSATAYAKLKDTFYGSANPVSTPNKSITVELVD